MASPARQAARYEDLLALPDHVVGEIVDSELVTSPRPGPGHAATAMGLGASLGPPFHFGDGGPGGWWILPEPELHLGESVLVPDLAGWRRDRLPGLPQTPYFHLIPDWVCEILSPSTALFDRVKKAPLYARHGVRHLWIIDPAVCTLEVFRNDSGHWIVLSAYGGRDEVRAEPFEQIALKLGRLWVEMA